MSLRERLNDDLKTAMRAKDPLRLAVIRSVKAAILEAETKSTRTTLDDDGIIQVIVKQVKERRESAAEFERAKRPDLVEKLEREMEVLKPYLPNALTEAELDQLIDEAIRQTGAQGQKDLGRVMGWITPRTRGRADGKTVSEGVREALQRLSR